MEIVEIRKNRKIFLVNHKPEDVDEDTPTFFFHHGAGGRAEQFETYVKHFGKHACCVSFDLVGHHRSSKPSGWEPYKSEEFFEDFVAIFKRYRTKSNYIICHSFGSAVVMYTLSKYFENDDFKSIHKVVLMGTSHKYSSNLIFYFPSWLTGLFRSVISSKFVQMAFHKNTDKTIIEREVEKNGKNDLSMMKALARQLKFPDKSERENIVKKCARCGHAMKFLVLSGETDGIFPIENGEFVAKSLGAEFQVVKNTSHNLLVERPNHIIKIIERFIMQDDEEDEDEGEEEEDNEEEDEGIEEEGER